MNAQILCFFILGVLPVVSLVIGLAIELAMKNKKSD